jgi:4-amino-4-deoxy-L-arabinose transferase-like glycosyltransferase
VTFWDQVRAALHEPRWQRRVLGVTAAVVLTLNVAALPIYPPPTCDEVLNVSNADSLLRRGTFGLTALPDGDPFYRDENMVHMGRTVATLQAGFYAIVGVSRMTARVFALLGWIAATGVTYMLASRLYGREIGLGSAAIFATSIKAFLTGHTARPDIWFTAVTMLALIGLWRLVVRPHGFGLAVAMGALGVLPFDFHGYGVAFLAGFCLVVFVELGLRERNWLSVFGYALGVVAGIGLWLAAHLLPDPAHAWYQLTTGYRLLGNLPLASSPLANLGQMLDWLGDVFWTAGGVLAVVEGALAVAGIGFAIRRRTQADRVMLIVLGVSLAVFGVLMTQRFVQYSVFWAPLYLTLGAAALHDWLTSKPEPEGDTRRLSGRERYALLCGVMVVGNLIGGVWLMAQFGDGDFRGMEAALREAVPEGTRVVADSPWWWALRADHTFLDTDYVLAAAAASRAETAGGAGEGAAVEDALDHLNPDYIVLDDALGCRAEAGVAEAAAERYAESTCELTTIIVGSWFGDVEKQPYQMGQQLQVYACPGG